MIKDVVITPLKILSDNRGKVMHMMRNDSKIFESFGEVYFSTIFNEAIKAWHLHKENTLNYACVKEKLNLFYLTIDKRALLMENIKKLYYLQKNIF